MRNRTVKRVAAVVGLALLVQLLPAVGMPPAMASECASCSGNCGCPAPQPVLEAGFGQSLFWQDPCGGGYRNDFMPCYQHNSGAPTWFASAEFLPLFRDESGSLPFQAVAIGQADPEAPAEITFFRELVLSSSDFDSEFAPGVRALFGRTIGDWYRVEFSYMGSHSWDDLVAVRYRDYVPLTPYDPGIPETPADPGDPDADPPIPPTDFDPGVPPTPFDPGSGVMVSPFSNFGDPLGPAGFGSVPEADFNPIDGLDYNQFASIRFSSRLNSAEANLRRRLPVSSGRYYQGEASCSIGMRYMRVEEEFGYFTRSTRPVPNTYNQVDVATDNNMIGPQLGAMAQFLVHDRAWIDVEIKGALLFSEARNTTYADLYGGEAIRSIATTRGSEDSTAFLGDLSVNLNYQFAPSLTVRAGYNAFWLDGVALATQNFNSDVDMLLNGPARVNHDGRVVYHGPSLGIVYAR